MPFKEQLPWPKPAISGRHVRVPLWALDVPSRAPYARASAIVDLLWWAEARRSRSDVVRLRLASRFLQQRFQRSASWCTATLDAIHPSVAHPTGAVNAQGAVWQFRRPTADYTDVPFEALTVAQALGEAWALAVCALVYRTARPNEQGHLQVALPCVQRLAPTAASWCREVLHGLEAAGLATETQRDRWQLVAHAHRTPIERESEDRKSVV